MKKIIFILMLLPVVGLGQTVKVNAGTSLSVIMYPRTANVLNTTDNAVAGFAGMIGIDFAETKVGFISGNIGIVQKGRRDELKITDELGNDMGTRTHRVMYTYGTAGLTMNFKLTNEVLIPFFSLGPRVDYLLTDQNNGYDKFSFGATGGFGLIRKLEKLDIGGRVDYLMSFADQPKTRTASVMLFFGFKLGNS